MYAISYEKCSPDILQEICLNLITVSSVISNIIIIATMTINTRNESNYFILPNLN